LQGSQGALRQAMRRLFEIDTFSMPGSGVGKTLLVAALAVKAGHSGISIYFTAMESLIRKLKQDQDSARQGKGRSYNKAALVIVSS